MAEKKGYKIFYEPSNDSITEPFSITLSGKTAVLSNELGEVVGRLRFLYRPDIKELYSNVRNIACINPLRVYWAALNMLIDVNSSGYTDLRMTDKDARTIQELFRGKIKLKEV